MAKSASLLVVIFLQLGGAQTRLSVEFVAKNAPEQWAVAAEITGTAELDGDLLSIGIKSCSLSRPERYPDAVQVVSIVPALGRTVPGGGWTILRRGYRREVGLTVGIGERVQIAPFTFTIPLDDADLRLGDGITFLVYDRDGQRRGGYVPVNVAARLPDSFVLASARKLQLGRFHAFAEPAVDRIAGEIDGKISQTSEQLTISIDSGSLYPSAEYEEDDRKLTSIQAVVARTLDGKMSIERGSAVHPLDQVLKTASKWAVEPIEMTIPLTNYAKHPSDRIDLRIIWTNSQGQREVEHVSVPYELPLGRNPSLVSTSESSSFPSAPSPADPAPLSRDLRAAIERDDLVGAANLASTLETVVRQQRNRSLIRDAKERVDEALTWLPEDTESFWVNQEPVTITSTLSMGHPIIEESVDRLAALDGGKYYRALDGKTVRFVIAGARNMGPSSGGAWRTTARDVIYLYFFAGTIDLASPDESIHGKPVWRGVAKIDSGDPIRRGAERTMREDENWIALARPDLLVVTNRRDLLTDLLRRIIEGSQTRALPPSLPEWRQVDREASFWGVRHYREASKPKPGERGFGLAELPQPDGRATGTAIEFYSSTQHLEVRYMSAFPLASRGPTDNVYREFQVDRPQTGVWRLVSDVQQRGGWPLYFALSMLGFGAYR